MEKCIFFPFVRRTTMSYRPDKKTEDEWVRRIAQGENFLPTPEEDLKAKGTFNVGYGHNLQRSGRGAKWLKENMGIDVNKPITREEADRICRSDLQVVYSALDKNYPWWKDLDDAGKYVMVYMCYNMGVGSREKNGKLHGLLAFPKMRAALQEGRYEDAAKEIVNSGYYKDTKRRAARNAELLRTGVWREFDLANKQLDSQGRYNLKDSHTGERYRYEDHPSRKNGERASGQWVKSSENPKTPGTQVQQESESQARTGTRTGSVKSKSMQNRALYEQEWIQHIVSGQKFYDHPTTVTVKGKSMEVVGYGHIITADKAKNNGNADKHAIKQAIKKDVDKTAITSSDAAMICGNDLRKRGGIFDRLDQKYPWWTDLDPKAQAVMVDMCYNQEIGYTDYPQVQGILEALRNKDYTTAANEMSELSFTDENRNNRLHRNVALMAGIEEQPTITREEVKGRQAFDPLAASPTVAAQGHTLTVGDSRIAQQVEQGGSTRSTVRSAQPARLSTVAGPAPRVAASPTPRTETSPAPRTDAPKDKTRKQLHDDSLKAQKILENFNRQHKYKIRDTHSTREGIAAAFEGKDVEVSKIITKALMNPTVVAHKLGLKDEKGNYLKSSRAVVEALGNLDKQKDQAKIDAMVVFAKEVQSKKSR